MHYSESGKIKNSFEIAHLLKNIQKSKQLISLSFKSLPKLCLTSLLDVQQEKNILIFDEPNPALTLQKTDKRKEVEFLLKLNKLPIRFKTKLIECNTELHPSELITHFPKEIYYPQNRGYYRLRTEFIDDIYATIFLSSTVRLPSQLINISPKGLCLRLPYSLASKFQLNQIIEDIYIQLSKQRAFSISAKIKNTRIENNYKNIAIGLEIYQQKSAIEKTIQQFIFRSDNNAINTNISL